jgi:protein TonB
MKVRFLFVSAAVLLGLAACAKTVDPAKLDSPLKVITSKNPDYPEDARKREREGVAIVELKIGTDGKVTETRLVQSSGHIDLDNAALEAGMGYRFAPPVSGGRKARTTLAVPFEFVTIIPYDELDVKPSPVNQVKPGYPEEAKIRGLEGQTVVKALLGKDGKVVKTSISQSSGSATLDSAALSAAEQWTFKPGMKEGSAVKTYAIIPFSFTLH